MQPNARIYQFMLVLVCLVSLKHALELVEERTKAAESTEALDMEEQPSPVTEYGKDMVTRKNPSDRDNGLKQLWEKVPANAPPQKQSQLPTSKNAMGIK